MFGIVYEYVRCQLCIVVSFVHSGNKPRGDFQREGFVFREETKESLRKGITADAAFYVQTGKVRLTVVEA